MSQPEQWGPRHRSEWALGWLERDGGRSASVAEAILTVGRLMGGEVVTDSGRGRGQQEEEMHIC